MSATTKSGHRVKALLPEEEAELAANFKGYACGTIRLHPGRWVVPCSALTVLDQNFDFQFSTSDVLVMTYPKSGTTWIEEIAWTMVHNPKLDNPLAQLPLLFRCPFLQLDIFVNEQVLEKIDSDDLVISSVKKLYPDVDLKQGILSSMVKATKEPRILKDHLPFSLLHPETLNKCKVIYVARNPLDVVVSNHHHSRLLKTQSFSGTVDTYVNFFIQEFLVFGPYWKHILDAWERRHHPNLLFLFYEDIVNNPLQEYNKINAFLGTNLSEDQVEQTIDYTSFEKMRRRVKVLAENDEHYFNEDILAKEGGFFRKGGTGGAEQFLTAEQKLKLSEWSKVNMQEFEGDFKYKSYF